jgi:hypothetical protein
MGETWSGFSNGPVEVLDGLCALFIRRLFPGHERAISFRDLSGMEEVILMC